MITLECVTKLNMLENRTHSDLQLVASVLSFPTDNNGFLKSENDLIYTYEAKTICLFRLVSTFIFF